MTDKPMTPEKAIESIRRLVIHLGFVADDNRDFHEIEALEFSIAAISELSRIKRALANVEYVRELDNFASAMWDWHHGDDAAIKRLAGEE